MIGAAGGFMDHIVLKRLSQRSDGSNQELLNLAAISSSTQSLGPGRRAAVWVQGCTIQCPKCIAPDWIPVRPAYLVDPELLAGELLKNPAVTGITISGGEPMLQASGLAKFVFHARKLRDINVICFSGFRLQNLLKNPVNPGVDDLLRQIDVLIDGPYIDRQNDNQGLRGSANQQIHIFSNRLKGYDFDKASRKVEIDVQDGHAFMVGIPTQTLHSAFNKAIEQARNQAVRIGNHERA